MGMKNQNQKQNSFKFSFLNTILKDPSVKYVKESEDDNIDKVNSDNIQADEPVHTGDSISITPEALKILIDAAKDVDAESMATHLHSLADMFVTIDVKEIEDLLKDIQTADNSDQGNIDDNLPLDPDENAPADDTPPMDDDNQVKENNEDPVILATDESTGKIKVFRNAEVFDEFKADHFDTLDQIETDNVSVNDLLEINNQMERDGETPEWDLSVVEPDGTESYIELNAESLEPVKPSKSKLRNKIKGTEPSNEDSNSEDDNNLNMNFSLDDDGEGLGLDENHQEPDGDEPLESLQVELLNLLVKNGASEDEAESEAFALTDRTTLVNKIRELKDEPELDDKTIQANADQYVSEGKESGNKDRDALSKSIADNDTKNIKKHMKTIVGKFFDLKEEDVPSIAKKVSTGLGYVHDFGDDKNNIKPIKKSHLQKHIDGMKDEDLYPAAKKMIKYHATYLKESVDNELNNNSGIFGFSLN